MEALTWFGFNDLGHLGCNSVDAQAALLFLGKLKHRVTEFATRRNPKCFANCVNVYPMVCKHRCKYI
jgi:hypothetical protein